MSIHFFNSIFSWSYMTKKDKEEKKTYLHAKKDSLWNKYHDTQNLRDVPLRFLHAKSPY